MNRALALLMGAAAVGVPLVGQLPAARAFRAGGIPVIFKPVSANTVIAVQLYLRGGSPNLTPAQAGIERFIGAASTRGTVKYTREEFAARTAATATRVERRR